MQNMRDEINPESLEHRSQGIRDLVISRNPEKLKLLQELFEKETNPQLKYEIRKAIHELSSLEKVKPGSDPQEQLNHEKLRRALKSDNPDILNRAFLYCVQHKLESFLEELQNIASKSRDPFHRICILRLKANLGPRYYEDVLDGLKDPDSRVICAAIEALGTFEAKESMVQIATFLEDPSPRIKASAIKVLADWNDQRALLVLDTMIRSQNTAEKEAAAHCLCVMAKAESLNLILPLLDDEHEGVRTKALRALEILSSQGSTQAEEVLNSYRSFRPSMIKDIPVQNQAHDMDSEPALFSNYPEIRMAAIQKIADSDSEDSALRILNRLNTERDNQVVATGVSCLARAKGDKAYKIRFLMNYLTHEDGRIRANAIEVLYPLLDEDKLGLFEAYLEDENNRVRGNAILAISSKPAMANLFNPALTKAVRELCYHSSETYQLTAIYCISMMQNPWQLPFLDHLIFSRHDKVREAALDTAKIWSTSHPGILEQLPNYKRTIKPVDVDLVKLPSRDEIMANLGPQKTAQPRSQHYTGRLLSFGYGAFVFFFWATALTRIDIEMELAFSLVTGLGFLSGGAFLQVGILGLNHQKQVLWFALASEFILSLLAFYYMGMEESFTEGLPLLLRGLAAIILVGLTCLNQKLLSRLP